MNAQCSESTRITIKKKQTEIGRRKSRTISGAPIMLAFATTFLSSRERSVAFDTNHW